MIPDWVNAASAVIPHLDNNVEHNVELCTLRQEKRAWWTCEACPQPDRWIEWQEDTLQGLSWKPFIEKECDAAWRQLSKPAAPWDKIHPTFIPIRRCKSCNRKRQRHYRAKKTLGKVLEKQIEHMGTSARFVTLSVPNELVARSDGICDQEDLAKLVKDLKAKMYAFSRTKAYEDHVIGAVEFYEQTYKIDDQSVDVNTHIHAVWLGKYWAQDKLQEAWGGIVHITKIKSRRAVMKYISKYVTKDAVPGTRAKETRGVLRG